MKNLKSILLAFILILSASGLQAVAITELNIQPIAQQKSFLLSFQAQGTGEFQITLLDEADHSLFFESRNDGESFKKLFNLNQLESNEYRLILEDEFKSISQPIRVDDQGITVIIEERTEVVKPNIQYDGESAILAVNWILPAKRTVNVEIRGINSEVIYTNELNEITAFDKKYDLSKLWPGNYQLKLTDGANSYFKTISIIH